jgi:hypothetical protein
VALGRWLREPSRPPSTRTSRADRRPGRQRPYSVKAQLTWRPGRRPAPPEGGSTAYGMAAAANLLPCDTGDFRFRPSLNAHS